MSDSGENPNLMDFDMETEYDKLPPEEKERLQKCA
jgi:hypothetical protein